MASQLAAIDGFSITGTPLPVDAATEAIIGERIARQVEGWLGQCPQVFNAQTGQLIFFPVDEETPATGPINLLVTEAARQKNCALRTDAVGIWVALPLTERERVRWIAVAYFTTRSAAPHDLNGGGRGGRFLPAEVVPQWCRMTVACWESWSRAQELQHEVDALSYRLVSTYEEISLLHRLTQNLRLSRSETELAQMSVDWLQEVLPAEGIAVLIGEQDNTSPRGDHSHDEPRLLLAQGTAVDPHLFRRLASFAVEQHASPTAVSRPRVIDAPWPDPCLRNYLVAPIVDGAQTIGWVMAVNHRGNGFGANEVDAAASVAAILGIHASNKALFEEQAELLEGIVRALTSAIDAKDPYTKGHSERVALVAVELGRELGFCDEQLNTLYLAGMLHDVGKIGINDQVLRKPGRLDAEEFEHIKTHARIGYNILIDLKQLGPVLPAVLHHHEAYNGKGYPSGLAGEDIPLLARIVAVADAYDAIANDRPYRERLTDEALEKIFREGAGRQWDPRVVEAFFQVRGKIREIGGGFSGDMNVPLN